jgi:hypothetical protein
MVTGRWVLGRYRDGRVQIFNFSVLVIRRDALPRTLFIFLQFFCPMRIWGIVPISVVSRWRQVYDIFTIKPPSRTSITPFQNAS